MRDLIVGEFLKLKHKMNLNNSEPIKEKEEMSTEDYERDKEMIVKEMNVKTIG